MNCQDLSKGVVKGTTPMQCVVGAGAYITLLYYFLVIIPFPWFYQLPAILFCTSSTIFLLRFAFLLKKYPHENP